MTKGFVDFWDLLRITKEKTDEFLMWRLAPGFNEISNEIDKNPPEFLENHLNEELEKFSELFSIEKKSALILVSLMINYVRFNNDLIFVYFLDYYWLSSAIGLESLELLKYNDKLEDLQNKGFIKIGFYDYDLAMQIQKVDQTFCDQYGIQEQISPINSFNKSFELTVNFVEELKIFK